MVFQPQSVHCLRRVDAMNISLSLTHPSVSEVGDGGETEPEENEADDQSADDGEDRRQRDFQVKSGPSDSRYSSGRVVLHNLRHVRRQIKICHSPREDLST